MSEIRVNNITNREGSAGPSVAGIPVVDSNSHFVVPTGRTGQRYADGGENIVRDGLVLYLDAKYSYPGASGTNPDTYTWYDMSGNENNGELINGVGYNAANGGSLSFDGVDDSVNILNSNSLQSGHFTFDIWFKVSSTSDQSLLTTHYQSYGTTSGIVAMIASGEYTFQTRLNNVCCQTLLGGVTTLNVWNNFSGTYDGNKKVIYVNSIEVATDIISGIHQQLNLFSIGGDADQIANQNYTNIVNNGNIASVKYYNKALTAQEIQQNFNATRSRYGI